MGFYIVLLFLCSYLLYVLIEEMYQNLLDEFGMDKSQSLSIDLLKKLFNLVVENKLCSKFKKPPLPPVTQINNFNFIKALCFLFPCVVCGFIGYIYGTRKRKRYTCTIEQNIYNRNNSLNIMNTDNNEPSTCSLCLNVFKPRMVLLPCKHICICTNCWIQFYQEGHYNCPICREYIEEVMNVYST